MSARPGASATRASGRGSICSARPGPRSARKSSPATGRRVFPRSRRRSSSTVSPPSRGVRLKVHLAVDTGMGRGGFVAEHLPEKLARLERMENLEVEGIGSHLPSADEDEEFTLAAVRAVSRDHPRPRRRVAVQVAASVEQRGIARIRPGLLQSFAARADALRSFSAAGIPGKTRHGDEPEITGDPASARCRRGTEFPTGGNSSPPSPPASPPSASAMATATLGMSREKARTCGSVAAACRFSGASPWTR